MIQIYSRFVIYCSIFVPFLLTSCKDDQYPLPNVPVNLTINLDLPSYQPLNAPSGWAYANGGSRGIVIYRNFDSFVALDRHSTYNWEDPCAVVEVNPDNFFQLIDTCSGSKYDIISGVVTEGPAVWGLKNYNTSWDGASTVSIWN